MKQITPVKSISGNLSSALLFAFFWLIGTITPKHMKRMLFTTAVHIKLLNDDVLHDATLRKLNAKMNLANSEHSLKAMEIVGRHLLDTPAVNAFVCINKDELSSCQTEPSNSLIANASDVFIADWPECFSYSVRDMRRDVAKVITPTRSELRTFKM